MRDKPLAYLELSPMAWSDIFDIKTQMTNNEI